jgi:DNA-binding winged helix-turn-helix (wHTH) protein
MHVYRFGPFELDPSSRALLRGKQPIRLSTPQFKVLHRLVVHAGTVVPKESLLDEAWGRAAITENSLEKVISHLRKVLDEGGTDAIHIVTVPHQGYRLDARVQQARRDGADAALEVQLEPYLKFVQGQAALDTLDRNEIQVALRAFDEVLSEVPDHVPAHIGMGMACGLAFEASTMDAEPDTASLARGIRHARVACAQPPVPGEAWSTLAYVLYLNGEPKQAAAAAYKASGLEPENWRHWVLKAYVTWGEERLRAARRVLTLCPGLALAHWLKTTIFIARGALDAAFEEVRLGCQAQDAQPKGGPFRAVGLHLLHGLVLAAHGRLEEATAALKRELSWADSGQLYAREAAANTWYALGALSLRQRKRQEAEAAFMRALTLAPHHVPATAALRSEMPSSATGIDLVIGEAIVLAQRQRHADAARVYLDGVSKAPPGSAGWQLPVEPTLNALAHREIWDASLTMIRVRAT